MSNPLTRHLRGNPYEPLPTTGASHDQTAATLALAYEQRTTNLVTLLNGDGLAEGDRARVIEQVYTRLGLTTSTAGDKPKKLDARRMF